MKRRLKNFIKGFFVALMMFSATLNLSPGIVFADSVTDSYADSSKINTGASSNYTVNSGQLRLATNIDDGDGADGAIYDFG